MIPPCAQSLLAASGSASESSSTESPSLAAWSAYAEPASPDPMTRQSVRNIFTQSTACPACRHDVETQIDCCRRVRQSPDANHVHPGQGKVTHSLKPHASRNLHHGGAGDELYC